MLPFAPFIGLSIIFRTLDIYQKNNACFRKLRKKLPKYIKSFPIDKNELMNAILQDHKNFSNGLKVFKGSCHSFKFGRTLLKKILKEKEFRYLFPQRTKPINIDTMPGDVVIWNLRTCHSGNALRLKYFKNISFKPSTENFLQKYLPNIFLESEKERAVIFSTFGKMGSPLKNFIKNNIDHPEIFNSIKNSNFLEKEIISTSEKLGLKILDIEKIKNDIS